MWRRDEVTEGLRGVRSGGTGARRAIYVAAIAVTAAVVLGELAILTKYPAVFIDEPWYANAAWNWINTGQNYDSMHAGARDDVVWPFIGNLPMVMSFSFFGLGLFQARIVSWVFGILLLFLTAMVGRKLFGGGSGLLACLLLALSFAFIQASHFARPDILLAFMGLLCYLLALIAFEKERMWLHALTGLLIVLAIDIHQNAILIGLGVAALYPMNYGSKVAKKPASWMFVFGGLAGVAYFLLLLVLPDTSSFINYYKSSLGTTHQMPVMSGDVREILRSLRAEIGRYHFYEQDIDFVLFGAGFIYLAYKRHKEDLLLLGYMAIVLVGFVMFVGNKHDVYAIIMYPFMMLVVAGSVARVSREGAGKSGRNVFLVSMMGLVIMSKCVGLWRKMESAKGYDYYSVTDKIKEPIPPGSRVMGLPNWWLGLSEYDYRSSLSLTYLHFGKGYSFREGLRAVKPDFLILDDGWRGLLVDEQYFQANGFEVFKMPRREFHGFLGAHGELLKEFSDAWHGHFQIYKLHWENDS